jgi:hypothetical protein
VTYDPFRDYPAPIFAIPGNHDGMVAPNTESVTLDAFLENFCAAGEPPHRTPEAGELVRTAQVQPAVYFTLEALAKDGRETPYLVAGNGGHAISRLIVDPTQLRIEYHPQSDGEASKTPDDYVTVELATRQIVHYQAVS